MNEKSGMFGAAEIIYAGAAGRPCIYGVCDRCHSPAWVRYLDLDIWACEECVIQYLIGLALRG